MTDSTSAPAAAAPGPVAGLAITGIIVVAVALWAIVGTQVVVGTMRFTEATLFGAFLLLWHWANLEQLDIKRLPSVLGGALVGIALAWQVVYLTQTMGTNGTILGLLIMVAGIYLQVINVLPSLFNTSTMLFLTVAAAPLIQFKVNFAELAVSTVVGGLLLGAFVEAVKWIAAKAMPTT
jgi:hypothetical protein